MFVPVIPVMILVQGQVSAVNIDGAWMARTSTDTLPIIDGHLDLAENVTLFGLDLTLSVAERRRIEKRKSQQATVSLPELERGGIAVVCATVTPGFLIADVGDDFEPKSASYRTPQEAEAQALTQIALYESWEQQGPRTAA